MHVRTKRTCPILNSMESISFVQVSEDDILPKYVCIDCWTKLSDFNKFYNSVDEAKDIYLKRTVKEEMPNVFEISCDADDIDGDNVSVKMEPMDHNFEEWLDDGSFENHPPDGHYEHGEADNGFINYEAIVEESKFMNWTAEENELATTKVIALPQSITAQSINGKSVKISLAPCTGTTANAPQISNSIKMTCAKCNLSIKTVSELIKHNRNEHHDEHIRLKCCETKLKIHDLLDHMEYHRNPDKYR